MEAISDFSLHGETVQEVLWMSKSVRANARMSDSERVGVFVRTRKALCVRAFRGERSRGRLPEGGPSRPRRNLR